MLKLLLLISVLFTLITNNNLVLSGAKTGLLLWYENVLPLLLPFMLISGLIEESITKLYSTQNQKKRTPLLYILGLGIFCGYPIGAKSTSYFINNNLLSKKMGNIILPLCNNVSPMFFIGFILNNALNHSVSIVQGYFVLFLPYLIFLIPQFLINKTNTNVIIQPNCIINTKTDINNPSLSEKSIIQITYVGLYIMICSILVEFILYYDFLPTEKKALLIGITEITRGTSYISGAILSEDIKTALILACTSFGGISSIMQTNKVIQGSGLSLINYIFIKVLCAISTYILCFLVI